LLVFDTFKAWKRHTQTYKKVCSKLVKTTSRNLLRDAIIKIKENHRLGVLRDNQRRIIMILARKAYKTLTESSFHIWKRTSLIKRRISIKINFEAMTKSMQHSSTYIQRVKQNGIGGVFKHFYF